MTMAELSLTTNSEQETQTLGQVLAEVIVPGTVVALNGQLGAGKTNFVRAVCGGLGIDVSQVNSPTFVLLQTYAGGRLTVAHFDTYRLADVDEFLAIGGDEYLSDAELVCFVEWAERIREILPGDHLVVEISHAGEASRHFTFNATGEVSRNLLTQLRSEVGSLFR